MLTTGYAVLLAGLQSPEMHVIGHSFCDHPTAACLIVLKQKMSNRHHSALTFLLSSVSALLSVHNAISAVCGPIQPEHADPFLPVSDSVLRSSPDNQHLTVAFSQAVLAQLRCQGDSRAE